MNNTDATQWRVYPQPKFTRDVKRLKKKHFDLTKLSQIIDVITTDNQQLLASKYKAHMLQGSLQGIMELHIDSDWLLMYEVTQQKVNLLTLIRTGSHDDLLN